ARPEPDPISVCSPERPRPRGRGLSMEGWNVERRSGGSSPLRSRKCHPGGASRTPSSMDGPLPTLKSGAARGAASRIGSGGREPPGTSRARGKTSVLDVAAVGLRLGSRDLLPVQKRLNGFTHVVSRLAWVALGGGRVVDGPRVCENALGVDHEDMRGGAHAVGLSDRAGAVVDPRRRSNAKFLPFLP